MRTPSSRPPLDGAPRRLLVVALAVSLGWCVYAPAPAAAAVDWMALEEIVDQVNFFRHSNKTFHRHLRVVQAKKVHAQAYATALEAAGYKKLGQELEQAYLREATALARANAREIHRVRNVVKNVVAFLTVRRRRAYNSARAIRVLQKDKEVQQATLERRTLEAQIDLFLQRRDMEDAVKGAAGQLMEGEEFDMLTFLSSEEYDKKWITADTKSQLAAAKKRLATAEAERAAQLAAIAASREAAKQVAREAEEGGGSTEKPPMVAASEVEGTEETSSSTPSDSQPMEVDEEASKPGKEVLVPFSCRASMEEVMGEDAWKRCREEVESLRESCLETCEGDEKCKDLCHEACDKERDEWCVKGFACEISMDELLGAGDRQSCFDKVEAKRESCLESCAGDTACEAVCNTACDDKRESKCAKLIQVFTPRSGGAR